MRRYGHADILRLFPRWNKIKNPIMVLIVSTSDEGEHPQILSFDTKLELTNWMQNTFKLSKRAFSYNDDVLSLKRLENIVYFDTHEHYDWVKSQYVPEDFEENLNPAPQIKQKKIFIRQK